MDSRGRGRMVVGFTTT